MKRVIATHTNSNGTFTNYYEDMDGGAHYKWVRSVLNGRDLPMFGSFNVVCRHEIHWDNAIEEEI